MHVEAMGSGEALVLVHGSWSDLHNWDPVAPALAERFHLIRYDRRGHGRSPGVPGTRREQEDDLAAILEAHGPAHVVGTSFGGSIALGLAARRPELVRSVVAHEPPLLELAPDPDVSAGVAAIAAIEDPEAAARQFVEEVALGPGAWAQLPPALRATMVRTAPAFRAEIAADPRWGALEAVPACPVLLSRGDASPTWFAPIVEALADLLPGAQRHTYEGAGHAPHLTHPADHLAAVEGFLLASAACR